MKTRTLKKYPPCGLFAGLFFVVCFFFFFPSKVQLYFSLAGKRVLINETDVTATTSSHSMTSPAVAQRRCMSFFHCSFLQSKRTNFLIQTCIWLSCSPSVCLVKQKSTGKSTFDHRRVHFNIVSIDSPRARKKLLVKIMRIAMEIICLVLVRAWERNNITIIAFTC